MKRNRDGLRRLSFILIVVGLYPGVALADGVRKSVTVTPLLSTSRTASDQPISLPQGPVTVGVSRYVIAPGAKLPVHKHPHPRYAYVEAGTLAVHDAETGRRYDYKPGDFIVEVLDRWHSGENTGSVPVELLVIDQTPEGQTTNTVIRP